MMKSRDSLYNKLNSYSKSAAYPFHMPGHKRNSDMDMSPYAYDITEIEGFDNLHHARGILKESMDMATEFYGTKRTYYLVNGSTCGLLSAISAAVSNGGGLLMARNCHKAVYNAVYLNKLKAEYVYPRDIESLSISGGIHPKDVDDILRANENVEAVIITSPTYEGVVSYVQAIAQVVHKYNVPLIVDEAHGAHFSMSEYFPKSAIECGADIVIQSVHKTLPAMTQTALLHVCSDRVPIDKIERFLSVYQSSSPSYVLMASIDSCIREICDKGPLGFALYEKELSEFREKVSKFTHIKLLDKGILAKGGCFDLDMGKLVFNVLSNFYTGYDLYSELRDKCNIQLEMAAMDYVIAMTSLKDTRDGFERLFNALEEIDRKLRIEEGYGRSEVAEGNTINLINKKKAVKCMEIYEAIEGDKESVTFAESSGRVACEYIYLYPPGIPVVVPGEMLDKTTIDYLMSCKEKGLNVQGQMDDDLMNILVIKEKWKEFSYGKNILSNGEKLIGEGYYI